MFPAPVCGKSLRRTNARRGALNAPQLLPPIPTFPAPVHRKSRAAFLAAPRWAPVESFPPERFRPLLRLGNGNPLTVISSVAGDMFPAPVCGKSLLRTNARRGASVNAPQLLPPVPTFPAPVHGKSRAARGRAPLPPRPRRGSTSRPAGHLWASPFLRARKPKSSGIRRAGRWTQSPSGPERGGIVPERAHTPPGYTDNRPKQIPATSLKCTDELGHVACAPICPQIGKANPKVPMPRPIRLAAPLRQQPRRAALGTVALLRKYNGGLDVAPPPHGSCFLLFLVWWHFWCFRLSLLRVRRPWPGPCTRAGAGAGPQAAARTTPPPHFKGKTKKIANRAPNNTARPKRGETRDQPRSK
jgi:hypothetical protein